MIVIDLEWNQSSTGTEETVSELPFEIIEIGAVKYGEGGKLVSEFSELIRPRVYKKMHNYTSKLVHLHDRPGSPQCGRESHHVRG